MASNNNWLWVLMQYNLKELRRRQEINSLQTQTAFNARNTEALQELQTMGDTLTEAIMIKYA